MPIVKIKGDKASRNQPSGRISSRADTSKTAKPALKNTTEVRKYARKVRSLAIRVRSIANTSLVIKGAFSLIFNAKMVGWAYSFKAVDHKRGFLFFWW